MWRDRINRPEPDPADPSPAFRNGIFGTFDEQFVNGMGDVGTSDIRIFAMMDVEAAFAGANDTQVADPGLPPDDDAFADLEHIDIFAGNDATLEVDNQGGDRFMANLQSIRIQTVGDAAVSLSNSRARDETDTVIDDGGDDFMPMLQSIELKTLGDSESSISLSISTSGEPGFLGAVRTISLVGQGDVSASLSASANFLGGTGAGYLNSLETINMVSEQDSVSLSISHSGSDSFMENLRTMFVKSANDGDASISISASANDNISGGGQQLLGENFMPSLETISVVSNDQSASLSISHSGGNMFMPKLKHMHVESGMDDASVSISASANMSVSGTGVPPNSELRGDNFMIGLETITVIAGASDASLSISTSGGDNFMAGLKRILVQGDGTGTAEISMSASLNFTGAVAKNFMQHLESIEVLGETGGASLSISNSGGDGFMQNLKRINLESGGRAGGGDRVDLSISASGDAAVDNESGVDGRGDDFMMMLESIRLVGNVDDRVSASISHSGGSGFMENLRHVLVQNTFDGMMSGSFSGDPRADFDASADVNFADGFVGTDFIPALETVTVLSTIGQAKLSLSAEGGASFFNSLHSVHVEGGFETQIALKNNTVDGFMGALHEIDVRGGLTGLHGAIADSSDFNEFFEAGVFVELRNVLNEDLLDDGELPPFPGTPIAGKDFLPSLERVNVESGRNAVVVLQNGSLAEGEFDSGDDLTDDPFSDAPFGTQGGTGFLPVLDNVTVDSALGTRAFVMIEGDDSLQSLRIIDIKANQSDDLEGDLTEHQNVTDELAPPPFAGITQDLAVTFVQVDGHDFDNVLPQLQDIRVMSNGLDGEDEIGDITVDIRDFMSRKFDVTLSTNELGEIDFDAHDTPGLREVSLSGEDVATVDISGVQTCFKELDLSGMAAESMTTATMNAGGTLFGDSFDVRIGSGDLDYTAAAVGETFIFTATDIGGADGMDVDITGFSTAAPGAGGDVIDLSLLGVAGLGELMVDDAGADVVITSTDADFTGEITLVGIATAASVTDDNFIFT